ncbi:helix-turn-helix domain-containing protein [Roseovarius sp. MMSF_3281]|uniref:helix-turn-helix domain-containing protein n=1 Tax=Roseovarius sp. MMSF_3281 TaxID=3046694 RepID=UPI00273E91E9|nr:helix-turn-helix transcriptional regulator [Roseovarius sp. MMSF_3281]
MNLNIAHSDICRNTKSRYNRLPHSGGCRYMNGMKLRLKELRKEKGWTQREVAEKAGISLSYYTELELEKKQINAGRMEAIAKAFGVQPFELIRSNEAGSLHEKLRELNKTLNKLMELDESHVDEVADFASYKLAQGRKKDER